MQVIEEQRKRKEADLAVCLIGKNYKLLKKSRASLYADGISEDDIFAFRIPPNTDQIPTSHRQACIALLNEGDIWIPGKSFKIKQFFKENHRVSVLCHAYFTGHYRDLPLKLYASRKSITPVRPYPLSCMVFRNAMALSSLKLESGYYKITTDRIYEFTGALSVVTNKIDILHPIVRAFKSSRFHNLKPLENSHSGKRCFIIGNGPSLRETDLSKLKAEITLSSNRFYILDKSIGWEPSYHACVDSIVLRDIAEELIEYREATRKTRFFFPYSVNDDDIDRLRWLTESFIPPGDRTTYLQLKTTKGATSRRPTRSLERCPTVTGILLQLALLMGREPIYLIGCDTNYQCMKNAKKIISQREEGTDRWVTDYGEDINHFSPDYFGPGKSWHDPNPERMIHYYKELKDAVDPIGKRIFNATKGGQLEVFPRVDYEELF